MLQCDNEIGASTGLVTKAYMMRFLLWDVGGEDKGCAFGILEQEGWSAVDVSGHVPTYGESWFTVGGKS